MTSPWVEDVTLRRMLPSRVDVAIRERRPLGIGRVAGTLYLVDAHGVVIDEYGPKYGDFDLPIIDGLSGKPTAEGNAVDEGRTLLAARVITALQSRQTCNAKRPSAAAAVRPCAVRLRVPCGESGCRVLRSGFLRLGRRSGSVMRLSRGWRRRTTSRDRS